MAFTKEQLNTFSYPTENFFSDVDESQLSFLLGKNTFWHNGIHFRTNKPIRVIYDAEVIAMRISEDYKNSYSFDSIPEIYRVAYCEKSFTDEFNELFDYSNGKYKLKSGLTKEQEEKAYYLVNELYSNDFVLLKHSVKNAANKEIIFYSLYNHLKPVKKMSVKQRFDLFYFTKKLKALNGEDYYFIEGYEDYYDRTIPLKIPSETLLSDGEYVQIQWNENGENYRGIISQKYIRELSSLEIRRPLRKGENQTNVKEYLTPESNFSELQKDSDIVIIFSQEEIGKRQSIGYVPKNTKLKIANKNNFETYMKTPSSGTGIQIIYQCNGSDNNGYIFFDQEDITDISEKYNLWKENNSENQELDYYYCADEGLFFGDELIVEKQFTLNFYKIKVKHVFKYEEGKENEEGRDGYILCETGVSKTNELAQYSWVLNGKTYNGYIDEVYVRTFLDKHKETKRYPRPEDTVSSDYLPLDYKNIEHNKLVVFSTESTVDRLVKAILDSDAELFIDEESDINTYINKYDSKKGLKISYINEFNKLEKGYIYFDKLEKSIETVKEKYNVWINQVPDKSSEKNTFENVFDISIEFIDSAKYNTVFYPEGKNIIKKDTIVGYSGYTITSEEGIKEEDKKENVWKNEDATTIHFEIFTTDVDFMNLKNGDAFSSKCKVNSDECYLNAGKLTTNIKQKRIDFKTLLGLSNQIPEDIIKSIFNRADGSYKNGILKKLSSGKLVDGEVYYRMQFIGKIVTLGESEYVDRDECFGTDGWYSDISSWKGKKDNKNATVYDSKGNVIKNKTIPIYKNYYYKFMNPNGETVVNKEGKTIYPRKAKYFYEFFDDTSDYFFIREEVFNKLKLLNDSEYIMEDGVSILFNEIYGEPKETYWTGQQKKITKGTDLIYKNRVVNEYSSFGSSIVKCIWEEVGIKNDSQSYWVRQNCIGSENNIPIGKVIYDEWNKFFTLFDLSKIDKYRCDVSDDTFSKFNLITEDKKNYSYKKGNTEKVGKYYSFSEFLNENNVVDNYYFENETEWNGNSELTDSICNTTQFEDKVKKQRDDYKFWEEASNLNNFPKTNNDKYFYFHPITFLQHLDKVCQIPEFNPYEGDVVSYFASPTDRKNGKLSTYTIKDNPGFAPIYTWGDKVYEIQGKGRFACITGSFNEDYQYLKAYNYLGEFYHEGLDLRGNVDTPVKALINCKVIAYGWYSTYGQVIFFNKKNDIGIYLIAHLNSYDKGIYVGKEYIPGDIVGYVGGSGKKDGVYKKDAWDAHLHITYYNYEYGNDNSIITINEEITFFKDIKSKLISSRKNPFVHDSEDRKPRRDKKGNIV